MNEGIKDVKLVGSLGDETEKGVVFIDLPFMITMLLDLSAVKVRPAHLRATVQWESKILHHGLWKTLCLGHPWRLSLVATRYYLDGTVVWWLNWTI